ncbi:MAG: hypothetical protein DRI34_05800 [Deltaproteobacteria bacterium]|nr:MAG: hypothetical protein DRI34_05800 [Deltaproteobacteria bacterium]
MLRRTVACLLAVPLLLAVPARADDSGQVIKVHLQDRVPAGRQPTLTVAVFADLGRLAVTLQRDDGRKFAQQLVNVPRDSRRTFYLPQRSGRHRWRGSLEVELAGGGEGGRMNLDFACEVVSSLGLVVSRSDLDIQARRLVLRARRPLQRVDLSITSDDGRQVHRASHKFEQATRRVVLDWPPHPGRLMKIDLEAHDSSGISERLQLVPWHYAIPHQEVEFDTGRWEIKPDQLPRLEHSYRLLQAGLKKYGRLLEVKLFIAGYTDTVAGADYNRQLSEKRARAIAEYFRRQGFAYPIYYQGFGEKGLKVPTPDETAEPRNRRAEYVLAAEPPPLEVAGAELRWKRLQ